LPSTGTARCEFTSRSMSYQDGSDRVVDVCTIGELARALGKSTATIRRWERSGWLPKSPYWQRVKGGRGPRRLYPVGWVVALVTIAEAEGLANRKPACIERTNFTALARESYRELFG